MERKANFTLLRLTQEDALRFAREKGEKTMTNFNCGVTLIEEGGNATIIIDNTLDSDLQEVYLRHEEVQLEVIQETESEGLPFSASCYVAHRAGLNAGIDEAKQKGVLEKYLLHRGVKSVDELR